MLKLRYGGDIVVPNNENRWRLFRGLAILAIAAVPGLAGPIFVANHSFEDPGASWIACGSGCSAYVGAVPAWTSTGTVGEFQPGTATGMFTSLSDGPTSGFTAVGTLSQTVGTTVVLGEDYTLQFHAASNYRLRQGASNSYIVQSGRGYRGIHEVTGAQADYIFREYGSGLYLREPSDPPSQYNRRLFFRPTKY